MNRKREIFIRLENLKEIAEIMSSIKEKEDELRVLFEKYDRLNEEENKVMDNWNNYLEQVFQRMDHISL